MATEPEETFYRKFPRIQLDFEPDFRSEVLRRATELGLFKKGMYTKSGRGDTITATVKVSGSPEAVSMFKTFVTQLAITVNDQTTRDR